MSARASRRHSGPASRARTAQRGVGATTIPTSSVDSARHKHNIQRLNLEEDDQLIRPLPTVSTPAYSAMAYVAPIHRSSSVRHALKLNFLRPEEECLVVAKSNRLEFSALTSEGLILRHTKIVYGQIVMLEKLRPSSAQTDHLFVGTDRHMYFTLSWDASQRQLKTEQSFVDLADPNGRDSQSRDRCFVDSNRQFMTLELYEGVYTILPVHTKQPKGVAKPVDIGSLTGEVLPLRIPEILVRSSTYLDYTGQEKKERARIATLFEDNQERAWLKVRELVPSKDLDYAELENEKVILSDKLDPTSSHLIPVPNPVNGLLVLSETRIIWTSGGDEYKIQPLEQATSWAAWTHVEDFRWLLADEYGWLYFLMLDYSLDMGSVSGFTVDKLPQQVSTPSTLVHLGGGFVYVGSHSGDSQVIQLAADELKIIQNIDNIAPIVDFAVMDMGSREGAGQVNEYSSGQARLVTGSGAWQDGSLRSVRSGVGVEELGGIDLAGDAGYGRAATDMFHLPLNGGSKPGDLLIVSYVDDTRMFHFDTDGAVEEIQCMVCNEPTILAQPISNTSRVLQCTSRSVVVYDTQDFSVLASWQIPGTAKITTAAASEMRVVVSLGGKELVALDLSQIGQISEIPVVKKRTFDNEISCLNVPNVAPRLVLIGFWQSTSLAILDATSLEEITSASISEDSSAVPRSVLLTQVLQDSPPTLFVSLADGHVVTFSVSAKDFALSNRQATVLGTQQANLKVLPRDEGLSSVFAIAEHSTLIYGSENRLIYSAVTAEGANCICSFDSKAFPGAVALATPNEVKIAQVERERTTHVQTLRIGETVRRIAYSYDLRVFGLGTIKREIVDNAEIVSSYLRLVDEVNFKVLSEFEFNEDEVVESVCRMEMDENGRRRERFVAGTSYLGDGADVGRGRIIVFEVTEDRQLKEVTEVKLKGACRALSMIDGKVVAALTKSVVIFGYEFDSLQRKAGYRTATEPIDLTVKDNTIIVSDLMKSVSILKYEPGSDGGPDKLEEVGRHHQIVWSTAIAYVDENTVLESDAEGNLILLRQNVSGVTLDDKRRLETISEFRLGEMVNKMKRIEIPATPSAVVVPRAFLATITGSIYLFGIIKPDYQNLLMSLQSNIAKHTTSPGNVPWEKWRAFRNEVREESEPLRFVDGEFIELFLDADLQTQQKIVEGLSHGVEEVKAMVESLRRMH